MDLESTNPSDISLDASLDNVSSPKKDEMVANNESLEDENQTYEEWTKSNTNMKDVDTESGQVQGFSEEDTKILLEKEFDDFYEDRIHKSAGPVVFLSKCLGMLPLIWTEDDEGAECKSYFNMYTFLVFFGWIGLAVLSGFRISMMSDETPSSFNSTMEARFFSKPTVDVYTGTVFANCLVAVILGAFKSRNFAEVLFNTAEIDSQLQLKEKHYDKLKNKCLFWIVIELVLVIGHAVPLYFFMDKIGIDVILYISLILATFAVAVLDLQYVHMCMALCKRYRMLNKIISHIIKPFKTFRATEPSNMMVQSILQYRHDAVSKQEARNTFDQIWEPSEKDNASINMGLEKGPTHKPDMSENICPALLLKGGEKEISREEETTVILQLDILRGIHSDLHNVGQEINSLLGFQVLVTLCCNIILLIMLGFFFVSTTFDGDFFWPFLVMIITPLLRIQILGHWAQVMKDTSMKPFWTMSQMSTLDGSPKLERQVQKFQLQASQKTARFTASGYFYVTRQTITKIYGLVLLLVFLLWKMDKLENLYSMKMPSSV